jgi:hypothetical protein
LERKTFHRLTRHLCLCQVQAGQADFECYLRQLKNCTNKIAKPTLVGWPPQFGGWKSTQVDFAI